uniref:Uncharacterized protein n=1 Tax=Cucumis melo TaxID=3656 RepID=A0A9I9EFN4_CUCME
MTFDIITLSHWRVPHTLILWLELNPLEAIYLSAAQCSLGLYFQKFLNDELVVDVSNIAV